MQAFDQLLQGPYDRGHPGLRGDLERIISAKPGNAGGHDGKRGKTLRRLRYVTNASEELRLKLNALSLQNLGRSDDDDPATTDLLGCARP